MVEILVIRQEVILERRLKVRNKQKRFFDFIKGLLKGDVKYVKITTLNSRKHKIADITINADLFK